MRSSKESTRPLSAALSAILFFILALVLGSCGGPAGHKPQTGESVRGVRVSTVRWESVSDEIEAPGTVIAAATASVASRTMGTVMQVVAREGDPVKRGQLLVLLDERELTARRNAAWAALQEASAGREEATRAVAAAQAQADVAGKTYERFVYLREQKSVSPQEFDEVEAKHRAALAALEQAKARRQQVEAMHSRAESEARAAETVAGYARVVAPFDGVVTRRTVESGSMVAPGTPLLLVEDTSRYRLEVTVDAAEAARLRRGTPARVRLDALPAAEFSGKIVELEAGADPASHTVRARIELPRDTGLRSGLFGRAWFRRGERRAIAVPRSAVIERGQLRGVYVVDAGDVARWRLVTLGQLFTSGVDARQSLRGGRAEILSGLSDGERIVLEPGSEQLDGKKVLASAGDGAEAGR